MEFRQSLQDCFWVGPGWTMHEIPALESFLWDLLEMKISLCKVMSYRFVIFWDSRSMG